MLISALPPDRRSAGSPGSHVVFEGPGGSRAKEQDVSPSGGTSTRPLSYAYPPTARPGDVALSVPAASAPWISAVAPLEEQLRCRCLMIHCLSAARSIRGCTRE